jgi:hypothetical protein
MKFAITLSLAIFLFAVASNRADELKLKDGSTIIGTIVGFEDNSFKVKTGYGFAVVQKDQVVSVKIEDAPPAATTNKNPAPAKSTASDESPSKPTAKASAADAPVAGIPAKSSPSPKISGPISSISLAPPSAAPAQTSISSSAAPAPAAVPAPVPVSTPAPVRALPAPPAKAAAPVQPPPIREEVTGNSYTNDTYAFRMYKPPDWDVIASAQTILPGAVAAMGTQDQTTYLIIGVEPVGKSTGQAATGGIEATEKRLRGMLENFRDTGEQQVTISGLSAIEKHFHGGADGRDWSGVMVFLPRAGNLYTIFGMTYADSDLVQIQENVIGRAISSLQFLPQ